MYGDSLEHSMENSDLFPACSNSDLNHLHPHCKLPEIMN